MLREFLTKFTHDQPNRHRFGHAFSMPGVPKSISSVASVGEGESPAKWDHIHSHDDSDLHTIGAVNEPIYKNGWVAHTPGAYPVQYVKINELVLLQGLIKDGVVGTVAFTLPVGYRPATEKIFAVISNNVFGQVRVNPNGNVDIQGPSSNIWVSLANIIFKVDS